MKFRLAIVGTGQITAAVHLPAAMQSPAIELVGLIDSNVNGAKALVSEAGLGIPCASHLEDLRNPIDGVLIATPNNTHKTVVTWCLDRGIPALVEKPLASTLADAEEIANLASRKQVTVAVGFCTRFHDSVMLLKELLDSGDIGQPKRFVYQLGMAGWGVPQTSYSLSRAAAGGGVLIVNGIHFIDRLLYWFGYPTACAFADDSEGGPEANAVASFHCDFKGGEVHGEMRLTKAHRLPSGFVLETDQGILSLSGEGESDLLFRRTKKPLCTMTLSRASEPRYSSSASIYQRQLEDFVAACTERRKPFVTAEEGVRAQRLIEWLYRSRVPLNGVTPIAGVPQP